MRENGEAEMVRMWVLYALMFLACAGLSFSFWNIQVVQGGYEEDIRRQSVRRVRLPGLRGKIYDRQGICLADNVPSYGIVVYIEELRRVDRVMETIRQISDRVGVESPVTEEDVRMHMRRRMPLPLTVLSNLGMEEMARWAEQGREIAGAAIHVQAARVYPEQSSAAHLIGYVGRASPQPGEEEEPYHYYLPEWAGRAGVERHFDDTLRGLSGGRLVQVDVGGYKHRELGTREPVGGGDIRLSLDVGVQRAAERVLKNRRGAVVVLDPRNGDVLALASAPAFDPNDFVPAISSARWSVYRDDPGKPMYNRATAGEYAPGSTFKPVVAMAGLEAGMVSTTERIHCSGRYELGNVTFRCWLRTGHGPLNLRDSIKYSCNVFYYELALRMGYDYVFHMARALGFGRRTGIAMDHERPGLLPDHHWKRRTQGDGWRDGDTANVSIGQGFLTVTPIQMAVFTAALANGGTVFQPRVVNGVRPGRNTSFAEVEPVVANRMNWNPVWLEQVRLGMRDVVMTQRGTGHRAAVHGVEMAGKTGTAEYGPKGSGLNYAWMLAFMPYEHPRYAAVIVIEEGVSGGVTAAPLMHNMMQEIVYGPLDEQEGRG